MEETNMIRKSAVSINENLVLIANPSLHPTSTHADRGHALSFLNQFKEALAAYDASLRLEPNYVGAHFGRGVALFLLCRFQEALAAYNETLRLAPDFAAAHIGRGEALRSLTRLEEALAAYNKALLLNSNSAEAHCGRGVVLYLLSRSGEALAACDASLRLNPGFAAAHIGRGDILSSLGHFEEALAVYESALRLNSDSADAHVGRGRALSSLRRFEEALAAYDVSLQLNPNYASGHAGRGYVLNTLNRFKEGLAAYELSFQLDPGHRAGLVRPEETLCLLKSYLSNDFPTLSHSPNVLEETSPLLVAAYEGNVKQIEVLIKQGLNVNMAMGGGGITAVYIAAQAGHTGVITALKAAGADVNMPDRRGATPAWIAAHEGNAEAIKALKKAGADINIPDASGRTPARIAAENGHASAIEALGRTIQLIDEAQILSSNVASQTHALHARTEDMSIPTLLQRAENQAIVVDQSLMPKLMELWALLNSRLYTSADMNAPDRDGKRPVHIAAEKGHPEVITTLHAAGADMNAPDRDGKRPVHIAAEKGHPEAITTLHAAGADINQENDEFETALYIAAKKGKVEVVQALIEAGADIDRLCKKKEQPAISAAAKQGHTKVVSVLIEAKADIHKLNDYGRSPIYLAAAKGHLDVIRKLYDADADLNNEECDRPPVYIAAANGRVNVIQFLHKLGANIDLQDDDEGKTPVYLAAENGHLEVMQTLYELGANVNLPDNEGQTPAHIAAKNGHAEIVNFLGQIGASLNLSGGQKDYTPIYEAARKGHVANVIRELQNEGVITGSERLAYLSYDQGWTLRLPGQDKGEVEVVKLSHTAGQSIDDPLPRAKDNLMSLVIKHNNLEAIRTLHLLGADVNQALYTAFYNSGTYPNPKVVKTFLSLGANLAEVNKMREGNNKPPLMLSAYDEETIRILIAHGVEVNVQDKKGYTPLHKAASYGKPAIIVALLEAKADANMLCAKGHTPLDKAKLGCEAEHQEVIRLLETHLKKNAASKISEEISSNAKPPLPAVENAIPSLLNQFDLSTGAPVDSKTLFDELRTCKKPRIN
jgi:ankyrin repeat protein/tetratricopeptide (TPR) repeat protein